MADGITAALEEMTKHEETGPGSGPGEDAGGAVISLIDGVASRFGAWVEAIEESAARLDEALPLGSASHQEVAEIRMAVGQGSRFVWQLRELSRRASASASGVEDPGSADGAELRPAIIRSGLETLCGHRVDEGVPADSAFRISELGEIAGGLAHRFNNLLTVVKGNTELLLFDVAEGDPAHPPLVELGEIVESAGRMTLRLLGFGCRRLMQPVEVDLAAGVRRAREDLEDSGDSPALEWSVPADALPVVIDPAALEQLLADLLEHAVTRAGGPDGRVSVEVERVVLSEAVELGGGALGAGGYTVVRVSDSGAPLDDAQLRRIFQPFQVDGAGDGLVLASVLGIVRQSGGGVEVESTTDHGLRVSLYLPDATSAPRGRAPRTGLVGMPSAGATILVVDDNEQIRRWLHRLLDRWGYQVVEAEHGRAAVDAAADPAQAVDLMITDVVMPVMSGPDAYRKIAESRPDLPVLFMSGFSENTLSIHRLGRGRDAILPKPVTPVELARKLGEVWNDDAAESRGTK
jgi:two-component system, cell cycle sensor histidine kinase and response regulator CckA